MNPLERAIDIAGWEALVKGLGRTRQAILKWKRAGRLPRTEFSNETNYAEEINRITDGAVSSEELLDWSRRGWNAAA